MVLQFRENIVSKIHTSQNINVHFVGHLYIFRLYKLLGLYYVVLHEYLPTDWFSLIRWSKHLHKRNWKTKPVQRAGHRGQLNVESEDKNCASYNWSIRNNWERIRSKPSVPPRSQDGHRAAEGHTNEHCTQHS
jgi:hypothetical protein